MTRAQKSLLSPNGTVKLAAFFCAFASICLPGCGLSTSKYVDYTEDSNSTEDPETKDATYAASIKALLDKECATSGCHVAGKQSPDLSSYSTAASGGPRSQIRIAAGTMPPGSPLSSSDQALFKAWSDAGFPE